jgi:hypothetical protein
MNERTGNALASVCDCQVVDDWQVDERCNEVDPNNRNKIKEVGNFHQKHKDIEELA